MLAERIAREGHRRHQLILRFARDRSIPYRNALVERAVFDLGTESIRRDDCYGFAAGRRAMEDEHDLLEAWRAGDRQAGSRLIGGRSREITWFFRNKVFDEDDIPDLVSQTFLRAVSAKDRFEGRTSFRRFMYAIARNVLREYLRSKTKREQEQLDFTEVCVRDLQPRSLSSLHSEKRRVQALIEALREVPVDDQVVLELKYFEGLSGRELAEVLDIPEGTVRGRLARGLERLRSKVRLQLQTEGGEITADDIDEWAAELRRMRGGVS